MRTIIELNRGWKFVKDVPCGACLRSREKEAVDLPHTWNAEDGTDGGNDYFRGTCCYARRLDRKELPDAEEIWLEIPAANASADVYVGDAHVCHHDGGYSTFRANITGALGEGAPLRIYVDNSANDRVYPQKADFTFYGGLYRGARLVCVGKSHFDLSYMGGSGFAVTPRVTEGDAEVTLSAWLSGVRPGQRVAFTVYDAAGGIVWHEEQNAREKTEAKTIIPRAHLWQGRRDPYLYTAEAMLTENGVCLDAVRARFGCRSFAVDPERGFILNGKPYPLRGVSRHQDRAGVGNALRPEHHREDMDLICEMGANTIRLAHYQHDQAFYDLCDARGMIVWAEIPYISQDMPNAKENALSQMKELIVQNYNHPSIAFWGLSNEITMSGKSDEALLQTHRELNELAHRLDSTRLTTLAAVSMCDVNDPVLQIPDIVAYNHYFGWYGGDVAQNGPWLDEFHRKFPKRPIALSEYGCEGLDWHTSAPEQGDYTEEYQRVYHEAMIRQLSERPYLWATYVWNMFDFGADARSEGGEPGQNHKGLVTFDRKYKKDAFYAYKAWLSDEPFVHICGKRYEERAEAVTRVTVYSNQREVELFANGKSLGKQTREDGFFDFDVPIEGETKLVARAGSCRDESVIRRVSQFNEKYRLQETGTVLNWFDIEQPEGYYSLNDKISEIMKSAAGREAMSDAMQAFASGQENVSVDMLNMMEGFTVLRLMGLAGTLGDAPDKDALLTLNHRLNQIPRV